MMPSTSSALVFLTVLGSISISHGQTDEKAHLARLMFSAFQCGTYAAMSDNEKEKARLFEVGVKAGREFLDDVNQGQITDEAGVVPEAVMTLLRYTAYDLTSEKELAELGGKTKPERMPKKIEGLSNDFVLGRIFEFSTSSAYKEARVAEKLMYAPEATDKARTKENAKEKYRTGNCWLVKERCTAQWRNRFGLWAGGYAFVGSESGRSKFFRISPRPPYIAAIGLHGWRDDYPLPMSRRRSTNGSDRKGCHPRGPARAGHCSC